MLFSHDGIHDSQTHLSSPPYFYEQLRRELALAVRKQKLLALIKIVFENLEHDQVKARDILYFSHELSQLTRSEDCIGRLGVNEVVIIVPDGKVRVEHFVQRLLKADSLRVDQTLQIKIASVLGQFEDTALTLLERLDGIELLHN